MSSEMRADEAKNYGFVINNRACIGCHACSTACKSENEVPLGVYRTWVKYTEVGQYPDARRSFQVTRCNHCANPPCVRICPVTAMYQREDGIVEFDPDVCIGCKACMQACPYDAIHIDPNTNTAAKCHYCSHRTDVGLEPACVVVCPVHAIIAGDMNDPLSEISQVLAREKVTVRKPEQGTAPKLFYIEGNDIAMHPTAVPRTPETFMWADVQSLHPGEKPHSHEHHGVGTSGKYSDSGVALRQTQPQGGPVNGPIQIANGRMAGQMIQVGYNAQHKIPWHWPVPAYLVTKGIGAGIFLMMAIAWLTKWLTFSPAVAAIGGLVSVIMMGLTTALLVYDLDRPERFLRIVLRPQLNSWLARGAAFLIGFSNIGAVFWLLETAAWMGWIDPSIAESARPWLLAAGAPFALGAAVYTAFLFGQCEGRDLWQSTLLPMHLVIQALMMGGAGMILVGATTGAPADLMTFATVTFGIALLTDLFVVALGEFGMPHASEVAATAAHEITHGRYKNMYRFAMIVGHVVPLMFVIVGGTTLAAVGAILAIAGLYAYEHAFVMAPQEVPNS